MAGKHTGPAAATNSTLGFNYHPAGKVVKAYAEGRALVPATNPHEAGSDAAIAYDLGEADLANIVDQHETAIVGSV